MERGTIVFDTPGHACKLGHKLLTTQPPTMLSWLYKPPTYTYKNQPSQVLKDKSTRHLLLGLKIIWGQGNLWIFLKCKHKPRYMVCRSGRMLSCFIIFLFFFIYSVFTMIRSSFQFPRILPQIKTAFYHLSRMSSFTSYPSSWIPLSPVILS